MSHDIKIKVLRAVPSTYLKDGDVKREYPVLEVTIVKDGEVIKKGYLSLFRGYRYQVSGSPSGDGDYGSSPVDNLLIDASIEAHEMHAKWALMEFAHMSPFGLRWAMETPWHTLHEFVQDSKDLLERFYCKLHGTHGPAVLRREVEVIKVES